MSQAVNETERINAELQQKAETLAKAKADLEAEVARLNRELASGAGRPSATLTVPKPALEEIKAPKEALERNQKHLDSIKERLRDVRQAGPQR